MSTVQQMHQSGEIPQNGLVYFRFDPATHPELAGYAAPLINLAVYLKQNKQIGDLDRLRNLAVQMLSRYRQSLSTLPVTERDASIAHYILCATIDDAVLNQPWNVRASWAEYGLAAHFHRDVNSGERFFEILKSNLAARIPNKPLLLLLYYCLAICFEGQLRLSENRIQEKQHYLEHLYQALLPEYGGKLSVIGLGVDQLPVRRNNRRIKMLPLLTTVFLCTNLALGTAYYLLLAPNRSDLSRQLSGLTRYQPPLISPAKAVPNVTPALAPVAALLPRLDELLATEIRSGDITLAQTENGVPFIRILKNPLFASASDQLDPNATALISRIAEAVALTSREVTVAGYTDGQPIRSRQFPSNHSLSEARAKTIAGFMQPAMPDIAIRVEGKGDSEPVASNATPEGRALNRRVEIYLTLKTTGNI